MCAVLKAEGTEAALARTDPANFGASSQLLAFPLPAGNKGAQHQRRHKCFSITVKDKVTRTSTALTQVS